MDIWLRRTLVAGALLFGGLLIAALLIFSRGDGSPALGPREAFEAHLAALDDRDWDEANSYVLEWCEIDPADAEAAVEDLDASGFSFVRAFQIEEVWLNERGTVALLDLRTPPGLMLPSFAELELWEGEWQVSCG